MSLSEERSNSVPEQQEQQGEQDLFQEEVQQVQQEEEVQHSEVEARHDQDQQDQAEEQPVEEPAGVQLQAQQGSSNSSALTSTAIGSKRKTPEQDEGNFKQH